VQTQQEEREGALKEAFDDTVEEHEGEREALVAEAAEAIAQVEGERDTAKQKLVEVHVQMKRKVADVQQIVIRHERTMEDMMLGMEAKMQVEHKEELDRETAAAWEAGAAEARGEAGVAQAKLKGAEEKRAEALGKLAGMHLLMGQRADEVEAIDAKVDANAAMLQAELQAAHVQLAEVKSTHGQLKQVGAGRNWRGRGRVNVWGACRRSESEWVGTNREHSLEREESDFQLFYWFMLPVLLDLHTHALPPPISPLLPPPFAQVFESVLEQKQQRHAENVRRMEESYQAKLQAAERRQAAQEEQSRRLTAEAAKESARVQALSAKCEAAESAKEALVGKLQDREAAAAEADELQTKLQDSRNELARLRGLEDSTRSEIAKLTTENAKLAGHCNNKQKVGAELPFPPTSPHACSFFRLPPSFPRPFTPPPPPPPSCAYPYAPILTNPPAHLCFSLTLSSLYSL
jgi:hypothetical protein